MEPEPQRDRPDDRRDVATDETLLEADLTAGGGRLLQSNGRSGRVDLLLERQHQTPSGAQRLVVELKRPSLALTAEHLTQIKRYASTLTRSSAVSAVRWEFWLVGTATHQDISPDITQKHRQPGHVVEMDNYDVWVVTWGDLIERAQRRYEFVRKSLNYDVDQDVALARVRARVGPLVPGTTAEVMALRGTLTPKFP